MAKWRLVITDMVYRPLGQIDDAFEVEVNRYLNGLDQAAFQVRYDNPWFATLASQRCWVKAYRDGVLEFFGPVWAADIAGEGQRVSLSVVCASAGKMAERLVSAFQYPEQDLAALPSGVASQPTLHYAFTSRTVEIFGGGFGSIIGRSADRSDVATQLSCPILVDSPDFDVPTSSFAGQPIRAYTSLHSMLVDSFTSIGADWYWKPTEPRFAYPTFSGLNVGGWSSGHTSPPTGIPTYHPCIQYVATLAADAPIGYDQTGVARFEYGRSLSGFQLSQSRDSQITASGQVANGALVSHVDSAVASWGRLDEEASFGELGALLPTVVQQSVELRKNPLRRLSLNVSPSYDGAQVPDFRNDYFLGDIVGVDIRLPNGAVLIGSGVVRVHSVSFKISANGTETVSLGVEEIA